jgi:NAD(P)-dependent dehydrogenase (short-subunit alcohol dehydrogenase family)
MDLINSYKRVLSGQVAIVTGVSSGLGRATALELAKAGASVALVARREDELIAVAREIETDGGRALVLPLDLALGNELLAVAERSVEAFDRIDILVNAAGTDVPGPIADLTLEEWDRVLNVNLRASFLLAKAVFPHMRRVGHGTIVNISSVAGKRGWANAAAYCASKFGVTGLTQALAAEGRAYGIRACVLYPGGMATGWGNWSQDSMRRHRLEPVPVRKALPPAQVAALIVWIAAAPHELVLNEVIITPLEETGWP